MTIFALLTAKTNTWEFAQKTGCKGSGKSNALEMNKFKSQPEYTIWYTPGSYVFPNMPYADIKFPKDVKDGTIDGVVFAVRGKDMGVKKPRGFSSAFFEYQVYFTPAAMKP